MSNRAPHTGDEQCGRALPDDSRGSNVLVCAPPDEPRRSNTCAKLLGPASDDRNVLSITCGTTPDGWAESWQIHDDGASNVVGFIDICEQVRSTAASVGCSIRPSDSLSPITTVGQPDVGSKLDASVAMYLEDWADERTNTVVCLDSLTSLLDRIGLDATVQLLRVLTYRVTDAGAHAHYHIDSTSHSTSTLDALRPLFDRIVDCEEGSDDPNSVLDSALEAIGSLRKRAVLVYLATESASVEVATLARSVTRFEREHGRVLPSDHLRRVYVSLQFDHLPALAESNLVRYDERHNTVDLIADLDPLLSVLDGTGGGA